jgi:hypothetical protein
MLSGIDIPVARPSRAVRANSITHRWSGRLKTILANFILFYWFDCEFVQGISISNEVFEISL